ncbi:MAG: tRNA uridine-5-carboxymethylaminomethyl(34) synthesis GTPase MnmE [bacterium]
MNIAAIATAYGVGAISIIRVSGPDCIELVSKVFSRDLTKVKSHTINYGNIIDDNNVIDEVMVSVMHAPRTFTTENSVEINCHGGLYVTNRVLETLLKNGFRLAEPGEFTKRAFLNGRIDLTQAEAIMDIIASENETSLQLSNKALRKEITVLIESLRAKLVNIMAKIEVHIDYPEYDDEIELTNELVIPHLNDVISEMQNIYDRSKVGKTLVAGIKTAIVGKPNVGKSSLLNFLLDEDKAIVSDVAGTTRDVVEGSINLGNITLKLIDTAGIRESNDNIEKIGITKSYEMLKQADLVILVLDANNITKEDNELLEATSNYPRVIVVNKKDLNNKVDINEDYILISAKNKDGIDLLEKTIIEKTKLDNLNNTKFLTNARQIALLSNGLDSLKSALDAANNQTPIDMVEIDIHQAYEALGEIIGVVNKDSLLNELFSKFCLGK